MYLLVKDYLFWTVTLTLLKLRVAYNDVLYIHFGGEDKE